MKPYRLLSAVVAAVLVTCLNAFAADPTGTWKWTTQGRDGQTREVVANLTLAEGKLTGTISGRGGAETPISEATFTNDAIAFTVAFTMGERSIAVKYQGKLDGDTIVGTTERPGRDGNVRKDEWKATRAK